jgi:hypothetical protein
MTWTRNFLTTAKIWSRATEGLEAKTDGLTSWLANSQLQSNSAQHSSALQFMCQVVERTVRVLILQWRLPFRWYEERVTLLVIAVSVWLMYLDFIHSPYIPYSTQTCCLLFDQYLMMRTCQYLNHFHWRRIKRWLRQWTDFSLSTYMDPDLQPTTSVRPPPDITLRIKWSGHRPEFQKNQSSS